MKRLLRALRLRRRQRLDAEWMNRELERFLTLERVRVAPTTSTWARFYPSTTTAGATMTLSLSNAVTFSGDMPPREPTPVYDRMLAEGWTP